jgi:nucleotide-binding universal stress UspA family protein
MPQLFRKILCPVDFDDNSMAALDLACKVAAQNDAALCLMHVVPFPLAASEIGPLPSESLPVWEHGAQVKLEQIGRERIPSSLRCEIASRSGPAVEAIIGAETELGVDLVVMATHGRSRSAVGHFFLGSVAERVVRESLCPVLVVPPRKEAAPQTV